MRKLPVVVGVAAGVLVLAGCGSSGSTNSGGSTTSGAAAESGTLTVFAAASLTASFNEIGKQFEAAHPGVSVKFNYNGSSTLVQQISASGGADVFASADQKNMDKLTKAGLNDGQPELFATNKLEIAVAPGNPKHITTFADLAKSDVKTVVCDDPVPCGAAALKVQQQTGVTIKPVSKEQAVTGVLSKVESGDADAGVVYVTDVHSAGAKVTGVDFPEAAKSINNYPITVVKDAKQAAIAKEFIGFVLGDKGQAVLTGIGFGKP